jgi:selenocysteine-specific elongation factor
MPSIIIGTAGHIDHGKSALVRALTGIDPDRLPEEKKRGITIDLGFADLEFDDVRLGFVDVPGHERFVKNMLAGAHGIDVLALVIAADEGVMPQTREHFDICRLLGVKQGLVVITKSDLVEDDMLSLVTEEARELVAGSFLERAQVVAVSSKTGEGLEQLRSILKEFAHRSPTRSLDFITRLPIDRAFSMKGFGAVVTGTLIAGEISEGSELELLPKKVDVRVRAIQVHGKAVTQAEAGQRTAVNLAGVDVSQLERGMLLTQQSTLRPTQIIDVQIDVLPHASRGVKSRSRVRLHIGAAEVLGRVRILDRTSEAGPGKSAFAQLRLELPIVAVNGDRFIIRSYSPAATVAGGIVLDPFATKHRGKEIEKTLDRLARLKTTRVEKLASFVESSALRGLRIDDVVAATGWKRDVVESVVQQAQSEGAIVETNGVLLSAQNFARLCADVIHELENHHKREPLVRGMLRETLREKVFTHSSSDFFNGVIAKLETSGKLVAEKDIVRATSHSVGLSEKEMHLRDSLEQTYMTAGVEAPSLEEAMKSVGVAAQEFAQARKVLQLLIDDHTLVRVHNDLFMHKDVVENLKSKIVDYGARHEPERLIDVAAFKDLAGVSRKYAIPLLEYFDRERVTRRAGDKRLILPV